MNSRAASTSAETGQDARLDLLREWLAGMAGRRDLALDSIRPASNDASFRRYFRVDAGAGSLIAMDAPPPQEDCRPFVHAARVFGEAGLRVPAVLEADLERGFLLLEDFGGETLLDRLQGPTAPDEAQIDRLYRGATGALLDMQAASRPGVFPDYDRALLERELMLYPDWYLARHREATLSDSDRNTLRAAFDALLANNLAQPRVYVHRDYHSRNLMVLPGDEAATPGILDFQDAVYGPVTYDLVSLLRDAYVAWPEERQLDWAVRWWESARKRGLPVPGDFGGFWRDLEWMGLQRHLKVLGIFARLHHRDGKDRYLADMPRVLAAAIEVAGRYDAFGPLARLIDRVENRALRAGYTF
ncbi:phosphotransferase [Burkholderiaceae bacterium FT117]|uniref:aminoglycoside phosphotransferase family protein n=1 Tax=Zeimonas sediminis TaxID=2944268 RepID=UPI002342ECC4|nr:phosphotransferase [Zeimonas sediminis]MCM5570297.1 phosphotransferase [Zeimonas sediminis]